MADPRITADEVLAAYCATGIEPRKGVFLDVASHPTGKTPTQTE